MKKVYKKNNKVLILCALSTSIMIASHAEYQIIYDLSDKPIIFKNLTSYPSLYSEWIKIGNVTDCINWTPEESTIDFGVIFIQTSESCKQNEERTVTTRKIDNETQIVTETGSYKENRIVNTIGTRESTGNKEQWLATTPIYTEWVGNGEITNCTNWSPSTDTVTKNQTFTQIATDCNQNQTRTRQDREIGQYTNEIKNIGSPILETRIGFATSQREAIGTKDEWVTATPLYGNWIVTNNLYDCTNWSPTGSSKTATETFTQTANDCKIDRQRTVQNREQETTTLEYRNVGSQTTEDGTLINQSTTRSYTVTLGTWTNNGTLSNCTNWSPLASTQQKGISFTQTATDCQIPQIRTRVEKYTDHLTGNVVTVVNTNESRTGTTSNTRSAIGTNAIKTCYYNKGADVNTWKYWAHGNSIWTGTTIPNVSGFWAMLYDFVIPYSNPTQYVQNLTKVSNTSLNYVAGGFTWNITRGNYVGSIDGFEMYQICIQ